MWDAITSATPDGFVGKTVLDIGAADGFFSIAAAASGASRVDAIDIAYVGSPVNLGFLSTMEAPGQYNNRRFSRSRI